MSASPNPPSRDEQAIEHYQRLLKAQPELPSAHYNLALLYRKTRRYQDALDAYSRALHFGIDRPQEVWSNIGVVYAAMRRPEKAAEMYERALEIDPEYLPALFNRGGLFEEAGEKQQAVELYRRMLAVDPRHSGALARLTHAGRITRADDPLLLSLQAAIDATEDDRASREELYFAMGKALDDLGRYGEAFAAYRAANDLGRLGNRPYDRRTTEQAFERVIECFDAAWLRGAVPASAAAPIFVCGMFRSGSTLVEQILSGHSSITAGGELDILPRLVAGRLPAFPESVRSVPRETLLQLGNDYLAELHATFPHSGNITDKRPDNFLYLGLIKALFPSARIVYTKRNAPDNCLSVYFQHLGRLGYATSLEDTAHYYLQHERLMRHWQSCFGSNILTVDYDELVRAPEPATRRLLSFLGLDWDERCLEFRTSDSPAKTASLWQVREPLHTRSSGRWRNYAEFTKGAEGLLQPSISADAATLRSRADAAIREARFDEAESLLRRCLDLAPAHRPTRHNLAVVLMRQNRPLDALQEADRLLTESPDDVDVLNLKAAILLKMLRFDEAIEIYQGVLRLHPNRTSAWSNLGHALRTVGRIDESIAAYRTAASLDPERGEPCWNLANLKTFRFTDADLDAMRSQLEDPVAGVDDRVHFHFALGKAMEDRGAFEESFRHYTEGNRLRRESRPYDPDEVSHHVERCKSIFTAEFFADRAGCGADCGDPVFIVGLPRAGSTLVEQILASHSAVEGTAELPHIMGIARTLAERGAARQSAYPDLLSNLGEAETRLLGEFYIEQTRVLRKNGTPLFLDKMPDNFAHLGLIRLILPKARVIDVRRHPLACGLSLFKHLFAHGRHFGYSLADIGRYYRDYVELMAHFDATLPRYVHRIVYESLVENTEAEVRRLLEYCGLPFEESCLAFFDNQRAVSTASSEQVRTPIFSDAVSQWRYYEPWLGPLKAEVGSLKDSYRT